MIVGGSKSPPPQRYRGAVNRHEFLGQLHRIVEPRTYLEIGVADGRSLTLATVPSIGHRSCAEGQASAPPRRQGRQGHQRRLLRPLRPAQTPPRHSPLRPGSTATAPGRVGWARPTLAATVAGTWAAIAKSDTAVTTAAPTRRSRRLRDIVILQPSYRGPPGEGDQGVMPEGLPRLAPNGSERPEIRTTVHGRRTSERSWASKSPGWDSHGSMGDRDARARADRATPH